MPFTKLTPMLCTSDIKTTIAFYTNTLGFQLDNYSEEWNWCHLHKDKVSIMLSLPNEHIPFEKITCTGSFYFYTNEADELWAKLKDASNVVYPIEDFEWGMREFAIRDNNGYILQFGKDISSQ